MVTMKKILYGLAFIALIAIPTAGCTLAEGGADNVTSRVTCHSGGALRFDDYVTGQVLGSPSRGYYFTSSTGRPVEVSGDCMVDRGAPRPADFLPVIP